MPNHLALVSRDERYAQARRNSSLSSYMPSPRQFRDSKRPASEIHKPKLLDQVRPVLRFRHYSYQTEKSYVHWIKCFICFHRKLHPHRSGQTLPAITHRAHAAGSA
jgi:hypothetical protein